MHRNLQQKLDGAQQPAIAFSARKTGLIASSSNQAVFHCGSWRLRTNQMLP